MADNFNLRQYLLENKLGAYAKTKSLKEATVEVEPSNDATGERKVHLRTDDGREYKLVVRFMWYPDLSEAEAQIEGGVDEQGRELTQGEIDELQDEYEIKIADAIYDVSKEDIEGEEEIVQLARKGRRGVEELEEGLSYDAIERMDGLVNRRLLAMFTDAVDSLVEDLEKEGFEHTDVREYLTMLLKEKLG